jgi:hypothetical protein
MGQIILLLLLILGLMIFLITKFFASKKIKTGAKIAVPIVLALLIAGGVITNQIVSGTNKGNTGASGTANTGSGSGSSADSVIFSKQAARGWFIQGYNEGYDKYEPFAGSPLYDAVPRVPAAVQNDANLPPAEKAAIANLYSAGYTAGWEDHSKGINPNAYKAWDNTSWGVYGPPYR